MSYYCQMNRNDGFGGQYQTMIYCILYAEEGQNKYAYRNINEIAHNYENDDNYIKKIEELMNLKNNFANIDDILECNVIDDIQFLMKTIEDNVDNYINSNTMCKIKNIFWENKERNHFKNNKINISIHIRRENIHDRDERDKPGFALRIKPNEYFLNIMNKIRSDYVDKDIVFHIYSQGKQDDFNILVSDDVIFHLDEDVCTSFIGLVASDILIISPSSFSYVAGLLSDGIIYFSTFWHVAPKHWLTLE